MAIWSREECELIVQDYLDMLAAECAGIPYSKAEHRRNLQSRLNNRSEGSIEYKHQNISAVLLNAGRICISGYKPAWNYQALLEKVVLDRIDGEVFERLEESLITQPAARLEEAESAKLFVPAPERTDARKVAEPREFVPRKISFAEREARNRRLGELGEEFVVRMERARLCSLGRDDLAKDVEWTSKVRGDGAGYDVRSFEGPEDRPLYIEVKSTNAGIYQPFLISSGEVDFSERYSDSYSLYRIFKLSVNPGVFRLDGAITDNVHMDATQYRASF